MKVFISMPMSGKTDEEVAKQFKEIANKVLSSFPNVEIIDSVDKDHANKNPLECLSQSIKMLSQADAAYFAPNWDKYRGCQIERMCCDQYGVEILGERKKNEYFTY